jgi:hypothetical protein
MRRNLFWLSDEQWRQIEPHLPKGSSSTSSETAAVIPNKSNRNSHAPSTDKPAG